MTDPLTLGDQAWLDYHERLAAEVAPLPPTRRPVPWRHVGAAVTLIVGSFLLYPLSAWLGLCSAVAGLVVAWSLPLREVRGR